MLLCKARRRGVDRWKYLLWGSFFSRIPSTPPSGFILKKKPPFLQYSLLGSLKLPGVKPELPPSSGAEGRVVISPVAISSSLPASWLRLLLEKCRSPAAASHLPPTVPSSHLYHRPSHKLILLNLRGQFARTVAPSPSSSSPSLSG